MQEPQAMTDNNEITAAGVRAQMKLPKGMEGAYDKIVKAGIQLMFSPKTREQTMQFMEDSGTDPKAMGKGVSSVMALLFKESNQTLPPNLIIPAGIELLVHAAEVAKAGGLDISKEQMAEGMGEMVQQILVLFGATPEQMQKMMSGMDSGQAAPAQPDQPISPPAPTGLIGGAMSQGA